MHAILNLAKKILFPLQSKLCFSHFFSKEETITSNESIIREIENSFVKDELQLDELKIKYNQTNHGA